MYILLTCNHFVNTAEWLGAEKLLNMGRFEAFHVTLYSEDATTRKEKTREESISKKKGGRFKPHHNGQTILMTLSFNIDANGR